MPPRHIGLLAPESLPVADLATIRAPMGPHGDHLGGQMDLPDGRAFGRADGGYDEARRATVWNARVPDRFPDVVVQAESERDVAAAVRHAANSDMHIGVASGGHSWAANHVRDGGMLLDVSRLNGATIDAASRTAMVGPGKKGHELCDELAAQRLFFPAGHCRGVALGGYLLQGGYGWNSRMLGPACESVTAVDVVTADGDLVHADATENSDLYWSARGAGPGFFGVVTRFHLALYDLPAVCGLSLYAYPIDALDDVYAWAHQIGPEVDRRVEMQLLMAERFEPLGIDDKGILVASPVFADSDDEARAALALLDTCPVRERALLAVPYAPAELSTWYDAVMQAYPDEHRYAADNMWTSAPADELLGGLRAIADSLPPSPSHFLWLNWGTSPPRQDMAYSLEDDIYLALYAVWPDAADDERYAHWPETNMAAMEHLASGIQLADENLGRRPARFVTDANLERLDQARARRDPLGRFHPWMGRP